MSYYIWTPRTHKILYDGGGRIFFGIRRDLASLGTAVSCASGVLTDPPFLISVSAKSNHIIFDSKLERSTFLSSK